MSRHPQWEARLKECLARYDTIPFEWGVSDCGHFVRDIAEAVTGTRPEGLRSTYACPRTWYRAARADGYKSLQDAVGGLLRAGGWTQVPPFMAPAGSIGIVGLTCAVRMPSNWYGRAKPTGFGPVPGIVHAWRV